MPPKRGLGRGLDALLPGLDDRAEVLISQIVTRAEQPRRTFPEADLRALAFSISQHGILQPLVVAKDGQRYALIAGERRLRAAKLAGLTAVPVYVRSAATRQRYELALIENLQRQDLSPLEEARAYAKLLDDGNLTQEQLARRIGKSRSAIANSLRWLALAPTMSRALEEGKITPGHANALLAHEDSDRERLFFLITTRGLSVRQAEHWRPGLRSAKQPADRPSWLHDLEQHLGTKVRRLGSNQRGSLLISYHAPDELEALVARLLGRTD